MLDPGNEECLSLIARVFPGKTKEDLLQSGEAAAVAARLDVHIRSKSPRKRGGSKGGPPTPRYLAGIPKLKFALGGEVSEHTASTAGLDYARSQEEQAVKEGKENVEKAESTLDGRKGTLETYVCILVTKRCRGFFFRQGYFMNQPKIAIYGHMSGFGYLYLFGIGNLINCRTVPTP